jgi:hypothetical protein
MIYLIHFNRAIVCDNGSSRVFESFLLSQHYNLLSYELESAESTFLIDDDNFVVSIARCLALAESILP